MTQEEIRKWRQSFCKDCQDYVEHPLSITLDEVCKATDEEVEQCIANLIYEYI